MATKQELQDAKIVTGDIVEEIKGYAETNFVKGTTYVAALGMAIGPNGEQIPAGGGITKTLFINNSNFLQFFHSDYTEKNIVKIDGVKLLTEEGVNNNIESAVSAIDLSSKVNLSIYALSNNGGTEISSSISQGDNSVGFNYQKNMNNELPKYININFNGKYNDDYFTIATTAYVDNAVSNIQGGTASVAQATDTTLGTIKLNPSENISLNSDGQLIVGGRIGQFEGTTGLFAPNDREPRQVGDYSLLITDAKGMDIGNRAFALVSGYGLACKSAAAGTTQYRITNNYANRIIAKMCEGGYVALNEESSKASKIIPVVSVTINGSPFTPDSSSNSSNDIIITTEETLNPDSAITNIRLFGKMQSYATIHTGNGVASWGGGRNLILGGAVTKAGSANDNCLVGMSIYSSGNGNACFGRHHIATKNRSFLAGTGHDTTSAKTEAVSALGEYSYIDSNTLFAVGNGTSHTARSNALEVTKDGIILKSPNGTRFRISVTDTGELITAEP